MSGGGDHLDRLESVLGDLGALNAHVKAAGGIRAGAARRAIYAYKEAASFDLLHADRLEAVRPVVWTGPCGKCGGDGVYEFWEGGSAPCRGCSGTGTATLRFAELALPDGQVWHHPTHSYDGMPGYGLLERVHGDRVEGWVLERFPAHRDKWRLDCARRALDGYRLNVTHRIPAACYRCGAVDDLEGVTVGASGAWPFSWSARACAPCYAGMKERGFVWPKALPDGAMDDDIALWASRRPAEAPERARW